MIEIRSGRKKVQGGTKMELLECMNQSLRYIEEHLKEEISYEEVARKACCSAYHYQRMFSYITNVSLSEYIRRRRLTLAAFMLQNEGAKVIDVALLFGYQSPTAFTRAFINMHGISPLDAKKPGAKLKAFSPISFQISIKGESAMNYSIQEKESLRLVGIKEEVSTDNGQNFVRIPKMWQEVCQSGKYMDIVKLSNGKPAGIMGACANFKEGAFEYYIASASDQAAPEGMSELTVAEGTWVVFECLGMKNIQSTWKRIYSEWFPQSGYEHSGGAEIEWYSEGDIEADDYLTEIWIPIVKK